MRNTIPFLSCLLALATLTPLANAQCGTCPPGSIIENEPNCSASPDTVNRGCPGFGAAYAYSGQLIPLGATVCGTGGPNNGDSWRFTCAQTTLLEVDFNSAATPNGSVSLYWLGPPDQLCDVGEAKSLRFFSGSTCRSFVDQICLPPGEYALSISMGTSTCQPYTFTLRDLPRPPRPANDVCTDAVVIPSDGPFDTSVDLISLDGLPEVATSEPTAATVWYKFTAIRDGTLSAGPSVPQCPTQTSGGMQPSYTWYKSLDGTCQNLTPIGGSIGWCGTTAGVQVQAGYTYFVQIGLYKYTFLRPTNSILNLTWQTPAPNPPEQCYWLESGDAGALPDDHQLPVISPSLRAIVGSLSSPNDQDMYEINVCDPDGNIIATTAQTPMGVTNWNTRLILFTLDGHALTASDDVSTQIRQSGIDGMFIPGPGRYLLAIAAPDAHPLAEGGLQIFDYAPGHGQSPPNGPGASLPLRSWRHSSTRTTQGPYVIGFYSACAIPRPCGSADFNADGDVGTDADIEAFFACLGGACCPTCGSADFDLDGDTGTDADIEAFFRVLAGNPC